MTKPIQMVAAGLGCMLILSSLSALAQTNQFLALNASRSTTELVLPSKASLVEAIHFCGENLPTDQPLITAHWSRTLARQAALANTLSVLKRRASVVFPLIEPILKQYQIPADFKFLPLLESAVTNRAVSRRGAAGFWQLMPQTAQSLGLSVSHRHDDRFNLQKATHAACRYLNELYDQLGSWMLVATAYNAGPNYIQQLSRRHPDVHPMALPYRAAETKAYLYQAIAVKELLTRPQAYRSHLSDHHIEALNNAEMAMSTTERAAILASFDMDETAFSEAAEKDEPTFIADSTTAVVLLTDDELAAENVEPTNAVTAPGVASASVPQTVAPNRLITRSMSEGPLAEGKFYLFQVVQPLTLNEHTFAVGDVIHAYVEWIDTASKRVFLRTDRLISAKTQETVSLKLVATEQPRQPGAALPTQVAGWQLSWEQL